MMTMMGVNDWCITLRVGAKIRTIQRHQDSVLGLSITWCFFETISLSFYAYTMEEDLWSK